MALVLAAPLLIGGTGRLTSLDERLLAAHNRERSAAGIPGAGLGPGAGRRGRGPGARRSPRAASSSTIRTPTATIRRARILWAGTRGAYAPEEMVEGWIEEKKYFRPGRFPDNSATGDFADVGHYTQLMWRESDRVGCALADGGGGGGAGLPLPDRRQRRGRAALLRNS